MVFYLIVVGALAYGGVYLLRRLGGGRHTKASQGIAEVLGQLPLSPKHTLFLIKVGGRVILAGATAESINPLAVIDDPEEVGELVSLARMNKTGEGCLRRTLGILKKKNLASLRKMKVFSARTDKLATLPAGPQPADNAEARQA
jgi:flagellar biogenesis protein FliO